MINEHLCNAVDCKAIAEKTITAMIELSTTGKTEKHTIRLCLDHYLQQKAIEYESEAHWNPEPSYDIFSRSIN